jgi:alpha-glucosidase (family GH31 glycosyl hydrolase)
MQLRSRLMPYLYTAARRSYDTGISMVSPLCVIVCTCLRC